MSNHCASKPCLNGATCVDRNGYFTCTCPSEYTGTRCQFGKYQFVCEGSECVVSISCPPGQQASDIDCCLIVFFARRKDYAVAGSAILSKLTWQRNCGEFTMNIGMYFLIPVGLVSSQLDFDFLSTARGHLKTIKHCHKSIHILQLWCKIITKSHLQSLSKHKSITRGSQSGLLQVPIFHIWFILSGESILVYIHTCSVCAHCILVERNSHCWSMSQESCVCFRKSWLWKYRKSHACQLYDCF